MNVKEAAFADNFYIAGSLNSAKDYWGKLTAIDPKMQLLPKTYQILSDSKRQKVHRSTKLIS